MQEITPGLMLIQGNRLEAMRSLMIQWMQRQPLAVLENECLVVQSNGISQWLSHALAADPDPNSHEGGAGIAAALDIMLPARFIWRHCYRSLLPDLPDYSAFDKGPLSFRLYQLLGQTDTLASQGLDALAQFLQQAASQPPELGRLQLAMRLADLFDQYQVYRADWLNDWQQGQDRFSQRQQHLPVSSEQAWQPRLWRLLCQQIQADAQLPALAKLSRAQVHGRFLQAAAACPQRPPSLPRRAMLFGLSSLPMQSLEALKAISHLSQIVLFVHNPSEHYWGDIVEDHELLRQMVKRDYQRTLARKVPENLSPEQTQWHGHPLLAAWGKQGRDYLRLLDQEDEPASYQPLFAAAQLSINLFESPGQSQLLQQLQDDILALRPLHERQALASLIDPKQDFSLRFHQAHSPLREVEILHDQLLASFEQAQAQGRKLEPRDVLVMVPDINRYAPQIAAVFGRLDRQDPRYIPFHLSDQSQRQHNPVLIGFEYLLKLPGSRFTSSHLLDLLDIGALRSRFQLSEHDLGSIKQWIQGAGVRWGLNGDQKTELALPGGQHHHSWQFGLERMLMGYAQGQGPSWHGIAPYPEISGLDGVKLGQLIQLMQALQSCWQDLQQPRSPSQWQAWLLQLCQDFFVEEEAQDGQGLHSIEASIDSWVQACDQGGLHQPVPLAVMREAVLAGLDQSKLSQSFLSGAVNFATLMPMRAIPFAHIWLLGMNDGDYPRQVTAMDFDLMAKDYRPGDRSRREDDRYLFLEALMSARERLVISWVGQSIRDNSEQPPSVLVAQLRDHLDQGWPEVQGQPLSQALTQRHPLQPFSRHYFQAQSQQGLFSYSHEWRALHDAGQPPRPHPLAPWQADDTISLGQLRTMLISPCQALLQQRLGIALPEQESQVADQEPFELDGLSRWQLQQPLLALVDACQSLEELVQKRDAALAEMQAQGQLLGQAMGQWQGEQLGQDLPQLFNEHWQARQGLSLHLGSRIHSHDWPELSLTLQDALPSLWLDDKQQRQQLILSPSTLRQGDGQKKAPKAKSYLLPWLQHLLAHVEQQAPVQTQIFSLVGKAVLAPMDPKNAEQLLSNLLVGFVQAMNQPLPCSLDTAMAWLLPGDQSPEQAQQACTAAWQNELSKSPRLGLFYPDFAAIWATNQFEHWLSLYQPLANQLDSAKAKKEAS